ncbi:MAG TPA: TolC family protein [Bryobacteraceae bacterium]|nr:TolC family protein [Bryobacteraceae bacterium]
MPYILIVGIGLALCQQAFAQPANQAAPLRLTLQDAMERAQKYSPQVLTANIAVLLAHEDTRQAKAALLPSPSALSQFIYTQPNGTTSGIFVPNDGPHIYNDQGLFHADLFAPAKRADYHRAGAVEAVARAKADLASRGLIATVFQDYYGMAVAERKLANARQSLREAQDFYDLTDKQQKGGEVARADVVKAQIQLDDRVRAEQEAQLTLDKARIGFAVLLFPDYRQDYTVVDDLEALAPLPAYSEIQGMAARNSPDVRAAQATVQQQNYEIDSARAGLLPTISMDYFFGISANQFALHNHDGQNLLGSVVQAQITIPLWTWGAARSRIKQAELKLEQAKNDLSFTQRQLLSELDAFYREAQLAGLQVASLRTSMERCRESLNLTLLKYQAGEAVALEVVDAQTTLRDARNAYDDGLVRYRLGIANLQTLTGAF